MELATLPISFASKITELDRSLMKSSAWRNSSRKHEISTQNTLSRRCTKYSLTDAADLKLALVTVC